MNNKRGREERRHERYDTEARVYFRLTYDIKTKVKFQILDREGQDKTLSEKYLAICKNVSAEGLCFTSKRELKRGDFLHLEIYLPARKEPIQMKGEVRWSQQLPSQPKYEQKFNTGVKLITVDGKSVLGSVYHDGVHQIVWSSVMESVFGDCRKLTQRIQV